MNQFFKVNNYVMGTVVITPCSWYCYDFGGMVPTYQMEQDVRSTFLWHFPDV